MSQTSSNLIGGEWDDTGDLLETRNPANPDEIVGRYRIAASTVVGQAVRAARKAWPDWADAAPEIRSQLLQNVSARIEAEADALADLLAREEGKALGEARGEVIRAARIFQFFAGEALRLRGDSQRSVRPGVDVLVDREPIGVVAAVTPWNFPIAIPAWKTAPALAYGNCVVLKPSEVAPGLALKIFEFLHDAGAPKGVCNLVVGGRETGQALLSDPGLDAVSFTGSQAVGESIRTEAAARGLRVQTEMGGKNPLVVMDDADLDAAVNCAVQGAYFSTGQRCTASSRIIVHKAIHDQFLERMRSAMKTLRIGDPREDGVDIGPVVNERQLAGIQDALARARAAGFTVEGGERLSDMPGWFMRPALVLGAKTTDFINQEEVFGPVATIVEANDFEDALEAANATPFGLSAGICTTSLRHARRFRRGVRAGMVMVNLPTAGVDYHVPFGGMKDSSYGPREQGAYAREFLTEVKTTYLGD